MDDYTSNILNDSKNEWSILLINYITPHISDGFKAIFNESIHLCEANDEIEKYLMTFQNLLSRIPKWNQTIVLAEQERIVKSCNCSYLEDLITCVHIIQLKILSCVRVGNETKKITIDIPDMSSFIHQIYINIARKLYSNIYLFEIDIPPLEQQRRNREFELLVQTCIMNTIRDKIPVETLLRQFIDETQEIEVSRVEKTLNTTAKPLDEPVKNEIINQPMVQTQIPIQPQPQIQPLSNPVNQLIDEESFQEINNMNTPINMNNMNMNNMNQSMNNMNMNQTMNNMNNNNENVFEPRKSSIKFNPEPSILEFDNVETEIKLEPNDSEVLDLEFEEL
jgi:hypothetical protein